MKFYTKDGQIASGTLVIPEENRKIINARHEQWLHYGWHEYTPPVTESEPSAWERIEELKAQLAESDYKALKFAEGWITAEDYAATKAERQALRDEINRLEEEISLTN